MDEKGMKWGSWYWFYMNRRVANLMHAIRYREGQLTVEDLDERPGLRSQIAQVDLIGVTREV